MPIAAETPNPGPAVAMTAVLDEVPIPPPPEGEGPPPSVTPGWRARALQLDFETTGHASAALALDGLVALLHAALATHPTDVETLLRDPPDDLAALVAGADPSTRRWSGSSETLSSPPPLDWPRMPWQSRLVVEAWTAP